MKKYLLAFALLIASGCSVSRQTSSVSDTEQVHKPWEAAFSDAYARGGIEDLVNCALQYPETSKLACDRILFEYDPFSIDYSTLLNLIDKSSGDSLLTDGLSYVKSIQEEKIMQDMQNLSLSELHDYYSQNQSKSIFVDGIIMSGVNAAYSQEDYYYVRTLKDLFSDTKLASKIDPYYAELRDTMTTRISSAVRDLSEYENALLENCKYSLLDNAESKGIDFVTSILEFVSDKKMPRREKKVREKVEKFCSENLPTRAVSSMMAKEVSNLYKSIDDCRKEFITSFVQDTETIPSGIETVTRKNVVTPKYSINIDPFIKYSEASNRIDWASWFNMAEQIFIQATSKDKDYADTMEMALDIEDLINTIDFTEKQMNDIQAIVKIISKSVSSDLDRQNLKAVNQTVANISNSIETADKQLENYLYETLL